MLFGKYFQFGVLIVLILLLPSITLAMPQIIGDVETEFGIYSPYSVNVVPNVPAYFIDPDLTHVTNSKDFTFTDDERSRLVQNGFVAQPSQFKQVYDIYNH